MQANAIYRGKRAFDLCLSIALALPAIALIMPCALVIWLESRANPFFVQRRVGLNKSTFKLVKLRTLAPDTADLPSHEAGHAVILRSGAFLRRLKLDELPQIWNVLRGEMSYVGPRPCLPIQSELIAQRSNRGVFDLKPGITGPAQVAGIDMSTPEKLAEIDASYLASNSWLIDCRLLISTVVGSGRGDAIRGG